MYQIVKPLDRWNETVRSIGIQIIGFVLAPRKKIGRNLDSNRVEALRQNRPSSNTADTCDTCYREVPQTLT